MEIGGYAERRRNERELTRNESQSCEAKRHKAQEVMCGPPIGQKVTGGFSAAIAGCQRSGGRCQRPRQIPAHLGSLEGAAPQRRFGLLKLVYWFDSLLCPGLSRDGSKRT